MGDVIKEFLVGLGFEVDESSLGKFNKAIQSATVRVAALYTSIQVLSAGIFYTVTKISEGFEQMGYEYRIIAPAINRTLYLRQELLKAYRAAGINIQQVVKNAVLFNMSVKKTQYAMEAIYKSVASRFFPLLTKQLDVFRKNLYANMPRIQNGLERFVKFVFKAFEATVILGARVWSILQRIYDFFEKLHKATDGWSTVVLGVLAAWNLLNLSFLATPLGMIIAGLVALLALLDDFETWKEGGESLFDWTAIAPGVQAAIDLFSAMLSILISIAKLLKDIAINASWSQLLGDLYKLVSALNLINTAMDRLARSFSILNGVMDWRDSVDEKIFSLFSSNGAQNLQAANSPVMGSAPLGSQGGNSSIANSINQATNINITGSADAAAIGKNVAGEQTRVNYDMVRNMKGATR